MSAGMVSAKQTRELEAALDECLREVGQGASLEACLARYPALTAQLEPLLRLALKVQSLREAEVPAPVTLGAARQRLLREAARLRSAQTQRPSDKPVPWWLNLQTLLRRSMATVAVAGMLLMAVLGVGTVAASANSLPGDALYPVKRITEEFQLLLTFDQESRVQLLEKLDTRRREEAKAVASSQRVAELSFRGEVESIEGAQWIIGGVPVRVSDETLLEEGVATGTFVRVRVRSLSDGTLLATSLSVEPPPSLSPPSASATSEQPTASATLTLPATPSELPPTSVPVKPVLPTSSPTASPTASPTPVPPTPTQAREVKVRFTGMIESMEDGAWVIDGRSVQIDESTQIDEHNAAAEVGATARVVAVRQSDGSLLAVQIVIESAAQPFEEPKEPFEFQGLIESFGASEWRVGGFTLTITTDTIIEGVPVVGLLAEVKAMRFGDGSLIATRIVVKPPAEEVQFEGLIQSLGGSEWIVEGVTVRLDAQTMVEGTPEVGAMAEVQGLLLADGAVLARRILVEAPTSGSPRTHAAGSASVLPT